MKRRAGKLFISIFVKSILIISMLLLAGVLSYKLAINIWQPRQEKAEIAFQDETVQAHLTEANADEISKNLIICYNKKTKEIKAVVLEIYHSKKKMFSYITIPIGTQITISDPMYKKIILDYPEFPQVLKLSSVTKYIDLSRAFEYDVMILEEILGIDMSYYTAIPESEFDEIFSKTEQSVPVEMFSKDYVKFLKTLDTKDKLKKYIEELYSGIKTNLSLQDKLSYLESYIQTSVENVSFELIKGKEQNSGYYIDSKQASKQLAILLADN